MTKDSKELFDTCIDCLSKELPVLRKMAGLTQQDLGNLLGVSRQTVTNIESGTCKMKWSLFLAAMFIFSINPKTADYLKIIGLPYPQLREWLCEYYREEK